MYIIVNLERFFLILSYHSCLRRRFIFGNKLPIFTPPHAIQMRLKESVTLKHTQKEACPGTRCQSLGIFLVKTALNNTIFNTSKVTYALISVKCLRFYNFN